MLLKGSMATMKIVLIIALSVGIGGLAGYKIATNPDLISAVKNKLTTTITPARDLRGTWISSLPGKGFQLQGQFAVAGSTTTVHEDGDIELIVDKVENNIAYGTMRYYNVCAWGFTIAPVVGKITVPKTCNKDLGPQPITFKVSSSAVDFGTINISGVTATMSGTFTTDLMHGAMTATIEPYGEVIGVFTLNRKKE